MRHPFRSTAALFRGTAVLAALGLGTLILPAARAQTQDLFVSNSYGSNNNGSISRFAGTGPGAFSTTATTINTPSYGRPNGLAFDARNDLFVANNASNSVTEFAAGTTPGTLGAGTTFATGLNQPTGLTVDARGDLFVVNSFGYINHSQGSITEFPAGATPGTFGPATTLNDPSLNSPTGVVVDAHGDLFVANESGNTITEFTAGATPGSFGPGAVIETGLDGPFGLALDARGDLFVANANANNFRGTITEFAAGATPGTFGATTTLNDPTLNQPVGLAFDPKGDLFVVNYVGDNVNGTVSEFTPTGAGTFAPGVLVETGLADPTYLAFGPVGPPPVVPESSQAVSLGLLLMLGAGGAVAARKKRGKA